MTIYIKPQHQLYVWLRHSTNYCPTSEKHNQLPINIEEPIFLLLLLLIQLSMFSYEEL